LLLHACAGAWSAADLFGLNAILNPLLYRRPLVRRFLSISLLLLITLPLVSPLFAASTAKADIPVCCRRDGKHHCMMAKAARHSGGDSAQTGTTSLRERCPYNFASPATVNLPFVPRESRNAIFSEIVTESTSFAFADSIRRTPSDRSHQKRGPPSLILSHS
jgi:hypothetical protein